MTRTTLCGVVVEDVLYHEHEHRCAGCLRIERNDLRKQLESANAEIKRLELDLSLANGQRDTTGASRQEVTDQLWTELDKYREKAISEKPGNCSECGARVERLYLERCPSCYDKLAGDRKTPG